MTKLLKEHPALVITMFWAYMTWISLLWETAYLRSFGITAVEYGTLQDILILSFRRPENILWVIGMLILIYTIPYGLKNKVDPALQPLVRGITRILTLLAVLSLQSCGAKYDAEYRANKIKTITKDNIFKSDLNYLIIANVKLKRENAATLSNQVIITKLGSHIFLYNPESSRTSITSISEVESIEIVHY